MVLEDIGNKTAVVSDTLGWLSNGLIAFQNWVKDLELFEWVLIFIAVALGFAMWALYQRQKAWELSRQRLK